MRIRITKRQMILLPRSPAETLTHAPVVLLSEPGHVPTEYSGGSLHTTSHINWKAVGCSAISWSVPSQRVLSTERIRHHRSGSGPCRSWSFDLCAAGAWSAAWYSWSWSASPHGEFWGVLEWCIIPPTVRWYGVRTPHWLPVWLWPWDCHPAAFYLLSVLLTVPNTLPLLDLVVHAPPGEKFKYLGKIKKAQNGFLRACLE